MRRKYVEQNDWVIVSRELPEYANRIGQVLDLIDYNNQEWTAADEVKVMLIGETEKENETVEIELGYLHHFDVEETIRTVIKLKRLAKDIN